MGGAVDGGVNQTVDGSPTLPSLESAESVESLEYQSLGALECRSPAGLCGLTLAGILAARSTTTLGPGSGSKLPGSGQRTSPYQQPSGEATVGPCVGSFDTRLTIRMLCRLQTAAWACAAMLHKSPTGRVQ